MKMLLAALALGFALNFAASAEESAPPFVLEVGERVYEISEGVPREIQTPNGEKVTVALQANAPKAYEGSGLAFQYPRAMAVRSSENNGVVTITCEGEHSPRVVIQIYTLGLQPDAVRQTLLDGLTKQIESRGGKFKDTEKSAVTRPIAGADREGRRLSAELGERVVEAEVFAFNHGERVVALLLQYNADEAAMASRYVKIIGESLK